LPRNPSSYSSWMKMDSAENRLSVLGEGVDKVKNRPRSLTIQATRRFIHLGMEAYADAVVGVPGEGLNVEQRKRLTIGVELAAKVRVSIRSRIDQEV
jgi:hypothetical protein